MDTALVHRVPASRPGAYIPVFRRGGRMRTEPELESRYAWLLVVVVSVLMGLDAGCCTSSSAGGPWC
jgi:hypothetical protein